ncbi:tetratricopeptide repeat protein [Streptomyces gardneri]|uniref:tetratricopeptide repeat protein n=1 Tax=Streptomyces gardneri TaxID=66892 RepID=UPI0037CF2A5B
MRTMGRLREAEAGLREVVDVRRRTSGERHPATQTEGILLSPLRCLAGGSEVVRLVGVAQRERLSGGLLGSISCLPRSSRGPL